MIIQFKKKAITTYKLHAYLTPKSKVSVYLQCDCPSGQSACVCDARTLYQTLALISSKYQN